MKLLTRILQGVWRDVEIKESGPVTLGPLRVVTETTLPIEKSSAKVSLKATARNLEDRDITIEALAYIATEHGFKPHTLKKSVKIGPKETIEVELSTTLKSPDIW